MSIKNELLALGMNENDIGNYCSDLHVKVNDISKAFISAYEFKNIVTVFVSQIDGKQWFDIPFAYTEN
jgi:phosphoribosylformylglycinamidine (FGAM) synthase-like amidotransferase family enzyme